MEQVSTITVPAAARSRRRRGPLVWLPVAAVVAIVALLVAAVLRPADNNPLVLMNKPAPDFTIKLYGGGALNLKGLRGKTVVANFWWSDCPPCIQEAPILARQWQAWRNKGVVFVGIDELDVSEPRDFLKTYNVTYPTGPDPDYVNIEYGATGQPETVFISPRGIVTAKYVQPFTDDATLAHLIEGARA